MASENKQRKNNMIKDWKTVQDTCIEEFKTSFFKRQTDLTNIPDCEAETARKAKRANMITKFLDIIDFLLKISHSIGSLF